MPLPLKPGYNFHIDRQCKPSDYEMKHLEVYRDYYGISYTVSGHRKFIMPHMIGFLNNGSVGMTPKNIYHRTSFVDNTPYERFVLKFTDSAVEPLLNVIGIEKFEELYRYPVYNFDSDIQKKIYRIFCDMLYEYEHYENESELILKGMLCHLIITIMRFHKPSTPADIELSKADTSILKAIKFMENNFLNSPTLVETANYVNFSPAHFSRLFKKVIGVTYSEYLNYIRIEIGRNLLLTTNLSIGEIAQLSGFDNSNYFCNVMKKFLGNNPRNIRRLR